KYGDQNEQDHCSATQCGFDEGHALLPGDYSAEFSKSMRRWIAFGEASSPHEPTGRANARPMTGSATCGIRSPGYRFAHLGYARSLYAQWLTPLANSRRRWIRLRSQEPRRCVALTLRQVLHLCREPKGYPVRRG